MKYNRQAKILEIIERDEVTTQDDLAERLRLIGVEVTQATISRDIKELRLVKVLTSGGKYRYASAAQDSSAMNERLLTILREAVISCDYANNILVVKTLPGMAQAVASSVDALCWHEVLGTIAGDDTLMMVCRAEKFAEELMDRFVRMVRGA